MAHRYVVILPTKNPLASCVHYAIVANDCGIKNEDLSSQSQDYRLPTVTSLDTVSFPFCGPYVVFMEYLPGSCSIPRNNALTRTPSGFGPRSHAWVGLVHCTRRDVFLVLGRSDRRHELACGRKLSPNQVHAIKLGYTEPGLQAT